MPWSWGLVVGLLAVAWGAGPAVLQGELVGAASGEAVAHAWGLTVAAEGLFTHGPFLRVTELVGAPAGWRSDLVDPANIALFTLFSTTHAWTLTLSAWFLAGALGATALSRRLGLDRLAGLVLVGAWVLGPGLLGGWLASGRSELWPLMLWPAHLAAVHGAVRGSRRDLGLAALSLAVMAHGGWGPLLLLLPWQLAAAWMLLENRAQVGRLVWIGLGGAVLCVPMLATQLSADPWWLARTAVGSPLEGRPLGTDVSGLLTGLPGEGTGDLGPAVAPVLWLAVLGRRRWWLLGTVMLLASAGPAISLMGQDWWSPWALVMHVVPPLRGLHGWPRIAHLAALPLGIGLAWAVQGRRRGALVALTGIGLTAMAVGPGPRVAWPAPLPANGPVVDLVPRGAAEPEQAAHQQALADRVLVGRWRAGVATSLSPSTPRPDFLTRHSVLAGNMSGQGRSSEACRQTEEGRLWTLGFRSVVLHDPSHYSQVQAILGDSDSQDGPTRWTLSPTETDGCPELAP